MSRKRNKLNKLIFLLLPALVLVAFGAILSQRGRVQVISIYRITYSADNTVETIELKSDKTYTQKVIAASGETYLNTGTWEAGLWQDFSRAKFKKIPKHLKGEWVWLDNWVNPLDVVYFGSVEKAEKIKTLKPKKEFRAP